MCGIAGIVRTEPQPVAGWDVLADISSAIAHRGPDAHGYFVSDAVGLAHRRLSIIDIAGGHQPMIDHERRCVLVYNGELYNFQSLRAELQAGGASFATRSDTEVLLKLASTGSFEWVSRLNGMFAFALWDQPRRRLLLARDRLGIKPLYYVTLPDELVFASEIKALLRHPRVKREVNAGRIAEYLAFRSLSGVETMFEGIHQVPPGHVLVVSQPDLSVRSVRFWPPAEAPARPPFQPEVSSRTYIDELENVLSDSVRRQLISDVPVGMYLSGGVDSSLITVLAQPFRAAGQLHTFSVGFEEAGFDESSYAHRVADQVGATHHALIVTERDYVNELETTVRQFEEPLNHAHTVQLQLLSRYAKPFVTVVLTGEGADELFGGYPRLHIPLLARRLRFLPDVLFRSVLGTARRWGLRRLVKLAEASASEMEATIHSARFVPWRDFETLCPGVTDFPQRRQIYEQVAANGHDDVDRILGFDRQTYLPALLMRLDKASMASAVECRVPFLDNEVIDCSAALPSHLKIRPGRSNKFVLKKIAERRLPRDVIYRRKVGFGTPLAGWFRNRQGMGRYLDAIGDPSARVRHYVDGARLLRLIENHRAGRDDHSEVLWGLVALELWCGEVIDADRPRLRQGYGGPAERSESGSGAWSRELKALRDVSIGGETCAVSEHSLAGFSHL